MTLISPFVGRIYDWYKKEKGGADIPADEDPGVASVTRIYNYLQEVRLQDAGHGGELPQGRADHGLAGCDLLTISPDLLEKLAQTQGEVTPRLTVEAAKASDVEEDPPRREDLPLDAQRGPDGRRKLSEGIRKFYADARKLEKFAQSLVTQQVA